MAENRDEIFIEQNIFGKCLDLFILSLSIMACLFLVSSVIDFLSQKQFCIAAVYIILLVAFIVLAYISVVCLNQKIGFSPHGIILLRRNKTRIWEYDDIDWLACTYGEAELPYNKLGRFLGRLFFKPVMDGVIFRCRGEIINLSIFSGKEFRRLAHIHIEPQKMITFIQAQKRMSEKSRLAKMNYRMSYNPYCVSLVIILGLGFFLFVIVKS